jgi:Xaa-Pro aminopeptidase
MGAAGVDALLLSLGADLPWLTGYVAMPLERLTMLVVPSSASSEQPTLVVPELEAPRVKPVPEVFMLHPWAEAEDPVRLVASLVRRCAGPAGRLRLAIGDRTWGTFVLRLQAELPEAAWGAASAVVAPLRALKDAFEVGALARSAAAADLVATALLTGEIPLLGRSEHDVSVEIARRLVDAGNERVNFTIVAAGPNAASPHHEPTERAIGAGEPVVCDFGGSLEGYCSDITRTVFTGPPPRELAKVYEIVAEALSSAVVAAQVGAPCAEVDLAARRVIEDAGMGEYFIHRTGHGIGLEEHEDPYMVAGNTTPIAAGHVFSVEPGIYVPGHYGVRIEDIVAATPAGPRPLNLADHSMTIVDA